VLLPGDPGRALLLAQTLLEEPRMFNHHRGLWGYTGTAADGEPLTIQSTGMGGPSAAIVLEELARLGAQTVVRVGTCGALRAELALGDIVVAQEAIAADGASRALGAGDRIMADRELAAALAAAAGAGAHGGAVVSCDLFYEPDGVRPDRWRDTGALAVEMETATLLRVAELRGLRAACVLAVSDLLDGGRRRIGDEELASASERVGRVAAVALGAG
jgi:DeoD family purine-nucleoside phosphorylase